MGITLQSGAHLIDPRPVALNHVDAVQVLVTNQVLDLAQRVSRLSDASTAAHVHRMQARKCVCLYVCIQSKQASLVLPVLHARIAQCPVPPPVTGTHPAHLLVPSLALLLEFCYKGQEANSSAQEVTGSLHPLQSARLCRHKLVWPTQLIFDASNALLQRLYAARDHTKHICIPGACERVRVYMCVCVCLRVWMEKWSQVGKD